MALVSSLDNAAAPFACVAELLQPQPLSAEKKAFYPTTDTPDGSSASNSTSQKSTSISPILSSKTSIASYRALGDFSHDHDMASSKNSSTERLSQEPAEQPVVTTRRSTRQPKPTQKAKQLQGGRPAGALVMSGKAEDSSKSLADGESEVTAPPASSFTAPVSSQAPVTKKRKLGDTETTQNETNPSKKTRTKKSAPPKASTPAPEPSQASKKTARKRGVGAGKDDEAANSSLPTIDETKNESVSASTHAVPASTEPVTQEDDEPAKSRGPIRITLHVNDSDSNFPDSNVPNRAASATKSKSRSSTPVPKRVTLTCVDGKALLTVKVSDDRLAKTGPRLPDMETEAVLPPLIAGRNTSPPPPPPPPQVEPTFIDMNGNPISDSNLFQSHIVNVPCALSCLDEADTIYMHAVLAQEVNRLTNEHLRKMMTTWCKCRLRRTSSDYDEDDPTNPRASRKDDGAKRVTRSSARSKHAESSSKRWPPEIVK